MECSLLRCVLPVAQVGDKWRMRGNETVASQSVMHGGRLWSAAARRCTAVESANSESSSGSSHQLNVGAQLLFNHCLQTNGPGPLKSPILNVLTQMQHCQNIVERLQQYAGHSAAASLLSRFC